VEVAPHHNWDLARAIWRDYGRSSLPRISSLKFLVQAGLWYNRHSKMQITLLRRAVLPRLVRHPWASAPSLVRRAMVPNGRCSVSLLFL
jgi:hypothetical protein